MRVPRRKVIMFEVVSYQLSVTSYLVSGMNNQLMAGGVKGNRGRVFSWAVVFGLAVAALLSCGLRAGAEGETGKEAYCVLIEPSFERPGVFEKIAGAKRTVLVPARETALGMEIYGKEAFDELGLTWEEFAAKAAPGADRLLSTLKPRYERDHRGVVTHAVLESENHRTASLVLAPSFREMFRKTLGSELVVLIPNRFTIFVFPKLASDYAAYGEAIVEMYQNATYNVSVEIFLIDDERLKVIGQFQDR